MSKISGPEENIQEDRAMKTLKMMSRIGKANTNDHLLLMKQE